MERPDASGGCGCSSTWERRFLNEPVAFPHTAEKHREICTSLTFEIAAGLLASDSRISIRATRDATGSSLMEGGNRAWIERKSCRCGWNLGGHRVEPEGATRKRPRTRDRDH